MKTVNEALSLIAARARALPATHCDLYAAAGAVAADDVRAQLTVPSFANAAMDGVALAAASTSGDLPLTVEVQRSSVAGDVPSDGDGVWEIMTGAPLPSGCDAVAPIETITVINTDANGALRQVRFEKPVIAGANVRAAGSDFAAGEVVVRRGQRLTPPYIAALAATGHDEVPVFVTPRVAVISTGNEVTDDRTPGPGHIRNSNAPMLCAALRRFGVAAEYAGIIRDDVDTFCATVAPLQREYDVILSTGAVSVGRCDFVADGLRKLGAEIVFHKVTMRPGKPLLFASFADGTLYFGLPGNPMSALIGMRFFVAAALRRMQMMPDERYRTARLTAPLTLRPDMRFYLKANVVTDIDGLARVTIIDGQQSYRISPLLQANCWAIVDSDADGRVAAGERIPIAPLTAGDLW